MLLLDTPMDHAMVLAGFHALSDPLRLKIIALLQSHELCVCDLCDRLHTSQSKLSFHLKVLKDANLIKSRQQGRWMYYRLHPQQLILLETFIADLRLIQSLTTTVASECRQD